MVKRKGRGRPKKAWYARKYTPMEVAQKALHGVQKLKGLVNSERHVTDTTPCYSGTVTDTTTNQTISLNQVAQGDTNSTRTGNSILMKTFHLKGYLTWSSSSFTDRVLFMVVQDKQQIGDSTPNFSDFYTGDINSFPKDFSKQRFKVLKTMWLKQTIDNSKSQIPINMFIKYQTHVYFNGTTTTDVARNGVYCILISNKAAASNPPTLSLNSRVTFYDN